MPTVDGKKFSYTPAGKRAAAKARGAKAPGAKNPDAIKTKADFLAGNLGNTIKNMGGGY